VVNALLTQLDKLRHKKNVLVVSTSNLAKAIGAHILTVVGRCYMLTNAKDSAFVDRADIVQYIDLPPREAIYEILRSCLHELVVKGIVGEVELLSLDEALRHERATTSSAASAAAATSLSAWERSKHTAVRLLAIAQKCRVRHSTVIFCERAQLRTSRTLKCPGERCGGCLYWHTRATSAWRSRRKKPGALLARRGLAAWRSELRRGLTRWNGFLMDMRMSWDDWKSRAL
jgi:SpoVK/Ycf46/Vps4 family AAA+-type ATPase